ncbi:UNVERIFIED_CONTAM: hypothetical protein FKN15_070233 [Acipenser sinensis]
MNTRCPPKRVPSAARFFTLQTYRVAASELQRRRTTQLWAAYRQARRRPARLQGSLICFRYTGVRTKRDMKTARNAQMMEHWDYRSPDLPRIRWDDGLENLLGGLENQDWGFACREFGHKEVHCPLLSQEGDKLCT